MVSIIIRIFSENFELWQERHKSLVTLLTIIGKVHITMHFPDLFLTLFIAIVKSKKEVIVHILIKNWSCLFAAPEFVAIFAVK